MIGAIATVYLGCGAIFAAVFMIPADELERRWNLTSQEKLGMYLVMTVLWPGTLLVGFCFGMVALCRLCADGAQGIASLVRRLRARRVPRATAKARDRSRP